MLVGVLEGLDEAQGLVHAAAHGQVVDRHLAQILLVVDDEEAAEGDAGRLVQHAVRLAHLHGLVGKQGDVHLAQTTLLARLVDPREMRKVAVGGHAHDLTVDRPELFGAITERDDLRGADKGAGMERRER